MYPFVPWEDMKPMRPAGITMKPDLDTLLTPFAESIGWCGGNACWVYIEHPTITYHTLDEWLITSVGPMWESTSEPGDWYRTINSSIYYFQHESHMAWFMTAWRTN